MSEKNRTNLKVTRIQKNEVDCINEEEQQNCDALNGLMLEKTALQTKG